MLHLRKRENDRAHFGDSEKRVTFGSLTTREALKILGLFVNYLSTWGLFLAVEFAAWLVKGHCRIIHFSDGSYYIDCVCYQPGYQGKC